MCLYFSSQLLFATDDQRPACFALLMNPALSPGRGIDQARKAQAESFIWSLSPFLRTGPNARNPCQPSARATSCFTPCSRCSITPSAAKVHRKRQGGVRLAWRVLLRYRGKRIVGSVLICIYMFQVFRNNVLASKLLMWLCFQINTFFFSSGVLSSQAVGRSILPFYVHASTQSHKIVASPVGETLILSSCTLSIGITRSTAHTRRLGKSSSHSPAPRSSSTSVAHRPRLSLTSRLGG